MSSTMIVMMMAITPSLNASSRPLVIYPPPPELQSSCFIEWAGVTNLLRIHLHAFIVPPA
jgi:hypothetical protein